MGGLAVMPFALIVLSGDQVTGPAWAGEVLAALAFLMTGLGLHMTQTAGLALAADRATDETRPRVVALLYVMFLIGMAISSLIVGWLLRDYDPADARTRRAGMRGDDAGAEPDRPLEAGEGAADVGRRDRSPPSQVPLRWADLRTVPDAFRLMVVVALGALGFNMQDVLLEPYGGEILGLSVGATTLLTASSAMGALVASALPRAGWRRGWTRSAWAHAAR